MARDIAVIPVAGVLLGALFQLFRDEAARQHAREIQEQNQLFDLGATSHMANKVFDRQADFMEEYIEEVHRTIRTLHQYGPTSKVLEHSRELFDIRVYYSAWLTPEIEQSLAPFEKAIREIGADAGYISATMGSKTKQQQTQRSRAIDRMHQKFKEVLQISTFEGKKEEHTLEGVTRAIREILRISDFVIMRSHLISQASRVR